MESQTQTNFILALLTTVMPILIILINNWIKRSRNKAEYGDNLLEAMNKTTESLKSARVEIAQMDQELRIMDQKHEQEINDLIHKHKRDRAALEERIRSLERVLIRYDISFTLTTHPEVKVENVVIRGREDSEIESKIKVATPDTIVIEKENT